MPQLPALPLVYNGPFCTIGFFTSSHARLTCFFSGSEWLWPAQVWYKKLYLNTEVMGWNVTTTVMRSMSSGNHDMVKTWLRNKQQSAITYTESVILKLAVIEKQIMCEWCHGCWMLWMGLLLWEYVALNFCDISIFGDFFGCTDIFENGCKHS